MAVTLLTNIDTIQPAYNPFHLVMSSTTNTNTGFNYIIDLYSGSTYIRRLKVPSIPTDNYFGYCEVASICSDFITDEPFNLSWNSYKPNTEQQTNFNLKLGEEYKYEWPFTDNFYCSSTGFVGKVGFTGTTVHQYVIGDYVFIAQTAGFTNSGYEGVHRVVSVPNTKAIVIDYPFLLATAPEGGLTAYQDNRKIVYSGLTTTAITVGNFAIQHENYINYTASTYTINNANSKFLTELPDNYNVRTSNSGYLNIVCPASGSVVSLRVMIEGGSTYNLTGTSATTNSILLTPAFPKNLNASYGSAIITTNTPAYTIHYINGIGQQLSEKKRFVIDTTCKPEDNVELLFEDLFGGFIPFNFHFITSQSTDITRDYIKKALDYNLVNGKYKYSVNSATKSLYSVKNQKKYSVVSEYMTEEEAEFIEQLFLSKQVYLNIKNTEFTSVAATDNSDYIPVSITDTAFTTKTSLKDALIQYTVNFELSNNRPLNI